MSQGRDVSLSTNLELGPHAPDHHQKVFLQTGWNRTRLVLFIQERLKRKQCVFLVDHQAIGQIHAWPGRGCGDTAARMTVDASEVVDVLEEVDGEWLPFDEVDIPLTDIFSDTLLSLLSEDVVLDCLPDLPEFCHGKNLWKTRSSIGKTVKP